jgi:hypothetical protein
VLRQPFGRAVDVVDLDAEVIEPSRPAGRPRVDVEPEVAVPDNGGPPRAASPIVRRPNTH